MPVAGVSTVVLIVIAALAGRGGPSSSGLPNNALRSPAPLSIVDLVSSIPVQTFASVGDGGVGQPFKLASGQQPLQGEAGKPLVLFIGADYCPFCAAERWGLVVALSRFGHLSGLNLTSSTGSDADPNTNTFDFSGVRLTSGTVDLQAVELEDRNGQPFQTPSAQQDSVYRALGSATIPFVDFGNRFIATSAPFDPGILQGLTWDDIAARLINPNDSVAKAIDGSANWVTAAICATTGNQPASVCQAALIPQLESKLPAS